MAISGVLCLSPCWPPFPLTSTSTRHAPPPYIISLRTDPAAWLTLARSLWLTLSLPLLHPLLIPDLLIALLSSGITSCIFFCTLAPTCTLWACSCVVSMHSGALLFPDELAPVSSCATPLDAPAGVHGSPAPGGLDMALRIQPHAPSLPHNPIHRHLSTLQHPCLPLHLATLWHFLILSNPISRGIGDLLPPLRPAKVVAAPSTKS